MGDDLLNPGYDVFWTYIAHFIHSPFYVYAYAFGDCLVNSLYAVYEKSHEGFAARYFETPWQPAVQSTIRSFWPRSVSTPATRPSGRPASA